MTRLRYEVLINKKEQTLKHVYILRASNAQTLVSNTSLQYEEPGILGLTDDCRTNEVNT